MSRPVIAVVGERVHAGGVTGWRHGGVAVPEAYVDALHRAGGIEAVLMPERVEPEEAERRLRPFDGVMLIGGGDLHPGAYGQQPHPHSYGMDEEADAFDLEAAGAAIRLGMPLLAICRGMQVLNVALGGTLDQHITDRDGYRDHGARGKGAVMHPVELEPGSLVAKAMDQERPECRSSHHQVVESLGQGLVVTGRTDDGVIEAVEHRQGWVLAVQWHPERSAATDAAQQGLFDALVERASG
jgi:putative glutamine amidotransferase